MSKSQDLFDKAIKIIPGGVNSPVRAFKAVGGTPKFIKSAKGSKIVDVDGKEYIDYICSWGPMILGHAHPEVIMAMANAIQNGISFGAATENEVIMAELICELVSSIQMVRMVNSGTEAVMSAIRLARGYTGKNKIIKFEGCYHGHSDSMLVKAGSGLMTFGQPDSLGVPKGCAADTLTAKFNDIDNVQALFETNKNEIAAIIIELIPSNMGVILPELDFIKNLKKLCEENNVLFIADEVITGFRIGLGGAQEYFGVTPDITTFGKIIGGGMPVGAYGGKKEIMELVAPSGGVYQAGTLSGNPVSMAAGIATLTILKENPQIYTHINQLSKRLADGLTQIIKSIGLKAVVNSIGSLSCLFFSEKYVTNYEQAKQSNIEQYKEYFHAMLNQGIYLAPSQFEATFISLAHTESEIDYTLQCAEKVLKNLK